MEKTADEKDLRQQVKDAEELIRSLKEIPVGTLYNSAYERTIGFLAGVWVGDALSRQQ